MTVDSSPIREKIDDGKMSRKQDRKVIKRDLSCDSRTYNKIEALSETNLGVLA